MEGAKESTFLEHHQSITHPLQRCLTAFECCSHSSSVCLHKWTQRGTNVSMRNCCFDRWHDTSLLHNSHSLRALHILVLIPLLHVFILFFSFWRIYSLFLFLRIYSLLLFSLYALLVFFYIHALLQITFNYYSQICCLNQICFIRQWF